MLNKNDPVAAPVIPVFFRYAIPSIFGLLAVSSASIVDGAFVGNYVGPEALAAINFSMPVVTFVIGIALMLAIGGSVYVGKQLGADKPEAANHSFNSIFWCSLTVGVAWLIVSLSFIDSLIFLLGASGEMAGQVKSYLGIFLWFTPIWIIAIVLGYMVRVDNQPTLSSMALVASALSNVVLDWLFIVKYQQGLSGAAWATGLSNVVTLLIVSSHFVKKSCQFSFKRYVVNLKIMSRVCFNGVSDLANEFSTGFAILIF